MAADPPIAHAWYRQRRIAPAGGLTRQPVAVIALALVLSWGLGRFLPARWQLALAGAWLVGLVGFWRVRGIKVLGPVCFYDLVRTGRQGRFIWVRITYAVALLAILSWVY